MWLARDIYGLYLYIGEAPIKSGICNIWDYNPKRTSTFELSESLFPEVQCSDEEFENRDGYYQNRRLSRVFRTSENGVTWYRDIDCIDYSEELVYDYGKREITDGNKETWNGLIYLLDSGGHIYPSSKIQIKNTEDFLGDNKCTVKALCVVNFLKGAPGFSIRVANEDALPKEWHMDYEIRPVDESYNKDVIGFLQDHNLYEMYRRNVDY